MGAVARVCPQFEAVARALPLPATLAGAQVERVEAKVERVEARVERVEAQVEWVEVLRSEGLTQARPQAQALS